MKPQDDRIKQEVLKELGLSKPYPDLVEFKTEFEEGIMLAIQKTRDDDLEDLKKAKIIVWRTGEMHITTEGLKWLKKRDNQAIKEVREWIMRYSRRHNGLIPRYAIKDFDKKFGVDDVEKKKA